MSRATHFAVICCLGGLFASVALSRADENQVAGTPSSVENDRLAALIDPSTGTLVTLKNKLTGETYPISGDQFRFETQAAVIGFSDAKLISIDVKPRAWTANYRQGDTEIEAVYALRDHFLEKRLAVTFPQPTALLRVEVSRPTFAGDALKLTSYGYPKFERKPGEEPCCTFFGRTAKGGLFTGIEMPFADVGLDDSQVKLAFAPNLKLKAGEKFDCEPVYFGIYQRLPHEADAGAEALRSESDAMVAMTSAVHGPPRHGFVPMACGWHCEMQHWGYKSDDQLAGDMRSLDFLAECGIDWLCDCQPWGGETARLNALVGDDRLTLSDRQLRLLAHAEQQGVKVLQWTTINNSHPWTRWFDHSGKPFRADRPQWLMTVESSRYKDNDFISVAKGNCWANRPFQEWLTQTLFAVLDTRKYAGWVVDGDFFGGPGWHTTVIPATCTSDQHDHQPGDSNYACQLGLARLVAGIRERYPKMYLFTCRPAQDLGVWALHNFDVCFTLLEDGNTSDNLKVGDRIREWSRVRVQRDFVPHYLDQPLLFPSRSDGPDIPRNWSSEHLDYILLSSISCSPNLLFYLPTKSGIPDADKVILRRWLDWGRKNIEYLQVRRDLPVWPEAGKVDGSAHIVDDRGLVLLFNSGQQSAEGQFALSEESIGLRRGERFRIRQHYPASDMQQLAGRGDIIRWEVPQESPLVLDIQPTQ